jgi:hypothetical protein
MGELCDVCGKDGIIDVIFWAAVGKEINVHSDGRKCVKPLSDAGRKILSMDAPMPTMEGAKAERTRCDICGSEVWLYTSAEGTQSYTPASDIETNPHLQEMADLVEYIREADGYCYFKRFRHLLEEEGKEIPAWLDKLIETG